MLIINRYLYREILKVFVLVIFVVTFIYIAVDFFEKIDNFLEKNVSLKDTFLFFLFKIPFIIVQITPISFFLSVIIIFSLMSKNNELIVLRASGASIFYLVFPIFILSLIFSFSLFFFF